MENTPKPIFTVGVPSSTPMDQLDILSKKLMEKMPDYYVLVYLLASTDPPVFNAFYPKELDERSFDELKDYVLTELKK